MLFPKIYFWRWENPFHFLRMALLYLEGVAVFFIVRRIYKSAPKKFLRFFVLSFLACGIFLICISGFELIFRGKQIAVFTGFGPIFTDRNAFAAFWIAYVPVAVVLAIPLERSFSISDFRASRIRVLVLLGFSFIFPVWWYYQLPVCWPCIWP